MRISTAVRNSMATAFAGHTATGGVLHIYSGSAPADPGTTPSGTLLVSVPLNAPAWGSPSTGVATLDVTGGLQAVAAASGTAGFARLASSTTGVSDLTVSATGGGGEVQLSSTTIAAGVTVTVTSGTATMPSN